MKQQRGFSLFEIIISIFIGLLLLLTIYSVFILSQRLERPIVNKAEITQNQRAVLDRISRELRQANAIVTTLPANEIEFEDGHGVLSNSPIQYIRYYLNGTNLYHQIKYYYFASNPSIHVYYNDLDENNLPPLVAIVEDKLIGEYISSLNFSGSGTITIDLTFIKGDQTLTTTTYVSPRNIN